MKTTRSRPALRVKKAPSKGAGTTSARSRNQNHELVTAEGFRQDGRRVNELRDVECSVGQGGAATADKNSSAASESTSMGSSFFRMGATAVRCSVSVRGAAGNKSSGNGPPQQLQSAGVQCGVGSSTSVQCEFRDVATDGGAQSQSARTVHVLNQFLSETFSRVVEVSNTSYCVTLRPADADEPVLSNFIGSSLAALLPVCMNGVSLALADAGVPTMGLVACASACLLPRSAFETRTGAGAVDHTTKRRRPGQHVALDCTTEERAASQGGIVVAELDGQVVFLDVGDSRFRMSGGRGEEDGRCGEEPQSDLSRLMDASLALGCKVVRERHMRPALRAAVAGAFRMRGEV